MITTTILEPNHLTLFVALVTIKYFKLRREREKHVYEWGLSSNEVLI